jgi:hypothetical protein
LAARGVASGLALSLCVLCGAGGPVAPAAAQPATPGDSSSAGAAPLDGTTIDRMVYERLGILEPVPTGPVGFVARLAEDLHVRTRESTVRRHMLLARGDRWSESLARESERALRALDIFDRVWIDARRTGDSTVATVHTRDSWTTSPEFTLERGGGRTYGSIGLRERNLLGRGQTIAFSYREAPEGISRSLDVSDPSVGGTRVRAAIGAANGTSGVFNVYAVERPFYAEDTRYAFGVRAERADNQVRLYSVGIQVAEFPRLLDRLEAYAGMGRRFGPSIVRLTASWWMQDRVLGEAVVVPGAPPEFATAEEDLSLRRLALEARWWRPRFAERTRVDGLTGVEDIDLSTLVAITGGGSLEALGSTADEGYLGARLAIGGSRRRLGFGWVRGSGSMRLTDGPQEATGRVDARWVNQAIPRHTLVVAVLAAGGYNTAPDFQLVVGGLSGLRAHGVHALSGDRLWRWNAESRWLVGREMFQMLSVGAAAFWDAAITRGRGSGDLPWQHDAGFGLRLALPGSAVTRVARFDIAWPISPVGPGPREPVFSFSSSQAF